MLFQRRHCTKNCVATGWGKDKFGKAGEYQVIMKQVEMDMVDHETCEKTLKGTRLGDYFELHDSFNCAGGEIGKDTCTGDGGGPLVCPDETGHYHQTGIVVRGSCLAYKWGCKHFLDFSKRANLKFITPMLDMDHVPPRLGDLNVALKFLVSMPM